MIDLTVSSDEDDDVEIVDVVPKRPREDDDAPRAQPREDDEDEPRKKPREDDGAEEPRKKPRAAAPPLAGRRTRVDRDDDAAPAADAARCAALAGAREPYVDDAFPAAAASLVGEADEAPAPAPAAHPFCACKALAVTDVVKSTTPNDGRSYWRCATRRCGFFAWAGDGPRKRSQLAWARLDGTVAVVTDYGFSANDLAQGGLGDCWFLSALSVVAERHDLVAKLFLDTARAASGCQGLRLFMDGAWTTILVDDQLPVTSKPRRENTGAAAAPVTAGGLSLAYVRSRCATTGATTLWAPLLEKAYAKAHGSFKSISGGQIAEALLDLTGARRRSASTSRRATSTRSGSGGAWSGGARAGSPWAARRTRSRTCGRSASAGATPTRSRTSRPSSTPRAPRRGLLRIRNPHGVGEWTGDWSDASEKWADVVSSSRGNERTGVNDGTFWIDFTHFLMGFSRVDVCVAAEKPRAASFRNAFPAKKEPWRVARKIYDVVFEGDTDLFVTALQPTQRGTFCRGDRKVSYRPGDLQLVAVDETGRVVAACFRGADCFDRGATFCKARARAPVYLARREPRCRGREEGADGGGAVPRALYAPDAAFEVAEADFDAAAHGASASRRSTARSAGGGPRPRWSRGRAAPGPVPLPAKWAAFTATADLAPGATRLAATVVRKGVQYELGDVLCEVSDAGAAAGAKKRRSTASGGRADVALAGLFAPLADGGAAAPPRQPRSRTSTARSASRAGRAPGALTTSLARCGGPATSGRRRRATTTSRRRSAARASRRRPTTTSRAPPREPARTTRRAPPADDDPRALRASQEDIERAREARLRRFG
ncbi:calcium-dependent cysteine-type endopeptidase [Aureococcus anophagefferens]|nr:calcium-dependent cysteine-type endopeptidase [Aureococcus anophagefferens]